MHHLHVPQELKIGLSATHHIVHVAFVNGGHSVVLSINIDKLTLEYMFKHDEVRMCRYVNNDDVYKK
jgi:hypothetical protein